jgi:hypothetical protein
MGAQAHQDSDPGNTPVDHDWIETTDSLLRLRPDGILEQRHKDGAYQTEDDARADTRVCAELLGDHAPAPLLVVLGGLRGQSAGARHYFAEHDEVTAVIQRAALVVGSAVSRVLANVLLGLHRPRMPLRCFENEQSALDWLQHGEP